MNVHYYFPYDCDTLWLLGEIEEYLGLENKNIYKMNYIELIQYIDNLALALFRNQI